MNTMENHSKRDKLQEDDPGSNFDKDLETARTILLNSLNSDVTSTTTNSDSSINRVVKLLAGKFDYVTLEQRKLNQKLAELNERKEQYKATMEELNEKLLVQLNENKALENTLHTKDVIIQNLEEERDRRDRIFDLCIQSNNGEAREENEVTMSMSPGGHRTYEIKMKQKVPYTIKIERLSPKIWEQYCLEEDDITDGQTEGIGSTTTTTELNQSEDMERGTEKEEEHYEEIQLSSSEQEEEKEEVVSFKKIKLKTSHYYSRRDIDSIFDDNDNDDANNNNNNVPHHSNNNSNLENGKRRNRFNSHSSSEEEEIIQQQQQQETKRDGEEEKIRKITTNNFDELETEFLLKQARARASQVTQPLSSSSSTQFTPTKRTKRSSSSSPEPNFVLKKSRPEKTSTATQKRFKSAYNNKKNEKQTSFVSSQSFPFDSLLSISNVTTIPEVYRINFDFSDCPVAQKFWYDEKYSKVTKYFIALHDDSDMDNQLFTLKEQKGLEFPRSFRLKFEDIATKLEATPNKRIFLDTRDFNFFSAELRPVLASFGDFISHFSFGSHLYSPDKLRSNFLLDFVFQNLPNLEYFSVNDDMLCKTESKSDPELMCELKKLHTIRLVNSAMKFTAEFLQKLLKYTPNLRNLYDVPLFLVPVLMGQKLSVDVGQVVRSVFTVSEDSHLQVIPKEVLDDLTVLTSIRNHLEQLDTRVSFIRRSSTRTYCLQKMTKIMEANSLSLKMLDLEGIGTRSWLRFPVLSQLTKLSLHLSSDSDQDIFPFFPKSFDISRSFPNLSSVELIMMHSSSENSSRPLTPFKVLDKHFPRDSFKKGDSPFSTVTKLSLIRFCPADCMKIIASIFKNIRILHIQSTLVNVSQVLCKTFGYWQQLRQLVLDVDTNGSLDSAFTGFDTDFCRNLRRTSSGPRSKAEANDLMQRHRSRLSIVHLKDLHLLKIVLRSAKGFHDGQPVISPFAVQCGFGKDLMPNLTVQIAFDDHVTSKQKETMIKALSPVLPFITIEQ